MSDEHDEEGGHERWLVSYADFMTLLFAFFTVLYATSEKNAEKTEQFQESVKKYLVGAAGVGGGAGPAQINEADRHNAVIEPPIKTYRDKDKPEAAEPLERAERFVEGLSEIERRRYVSDLTQDEWGVRVTLPAAPLFSAGSDRFKPEALEFLKKLGALIVKSRRRALIEGHAARGERGSARSTWDFASARAVNVLRFVERAAGASPGQLAATSFGDARPLFTDGDPARNARLELVLLNPDVPF